MEDTAERMSVQPPAPDFSASWGTSSTCKVPRWWYRPATGDRGVTCTPCHLWTCDDCRPALADALSDRLAALWTASGPFSICWYPADRPAREALRKWCHKNRVRFLAVPIALGRQVRRWRWGGEVHEVWTFEGLVVFATAPIDNRIARDHTKETQIPSTKNTKDLRLFQPAEALDLLRRVLADACRNPSMSAGWSDVRAAPRQADHEPQQRNLPPVDAWTTEPPPDPDPLFHLGYGWSSAQVDAAIAAAPADLSPAARGNWVRARLEDLPGLPNRVLSLVDHVTDPPTTGHTGPVSTDVLPVAEQAVTTARGVKA